MSRANGANGGTASAVPSPDPELDTHIAVPVTHHHVERDWGTQHVVTAGDPTRPAILLVHGWPQHWFAWRRVIERLVDHAHVIAVDLRGFGWSTTSRRRARATSVQDMAADLPHVLDGLGVHQAVLAAHDWGGCIGFQAMEADRAAHAADPAVACRFTGYGALAIMPPWLAWKPMARYVYDWDYMIMMAAVGQLVAHDRSAVRAMVTRTTTRPIWATTDGQFALDSYLTRVGHGVTPTMSHALYRDAVLHELPRAVFRPRPAPSGRPTTVILGDHEVVARPAYWWRKTQPGEIDLVTIPDAGHWLAEEAPISVAEALLDLLSRSHPASAPAPRRTAHLVATGRTATAGPRIPWPLPR